MAGSLNGKKRRGRNGLLWKVGLLLPQTLSPSGHSFHDAGWQQLEMPSWQRTGSGSSSPVGSSAVVIFPGGLHSGPGSPLNWE